jgi:hypothetical protein
MTPKTSKSKTAVEWLVEQVNADCLNSTFIRPELVKDALELEKEQIEEAWKLGNLPTSLGRVLTEQDYYNEKYGGDK